MKNIYLFCLFVSVTSCSNDDEAGNININCTEVFVSGLSVTILDSQTNETLTAGVTVIATEGDYSETLTLVEGLFIGAGERAGTYSVTATAPHYMPGTIADILVTEDECHVITEAVAIDLTPI